MGTAVRPCRGINLPSMGGEHTARPSREKNGEKVKEGPSAGVGETQPRR